MLPENWEDQIKESKVVLIFLGIYLDEKNTQYEQHPSAPAGYDFSYIGPSMSVLKFRFEQGQFPLSITKFGNSQPVQGLQKWVDKVLA